MLRACIDARGILLPNGTGVATYAAGLAACLPLAGWEPELLAASAWDEAAGAPETLPEGGPARARRWAAALAPWPRAAPAGPAVRTAQVAAGLPPAAIRAVPDVFRTAQVHFDLYGRFLPVADHRAPPTLAHWSCPLPVRFRGVPNVYAVLDLIPVLHPELTPMSRARTLRMLRRVGQAASHVVTISEASRQEILATLGWRPDRVTNLHLPVFAAPADAPDEAVRDATARLGLRPGEYFLHVGQVEPRKNLARLAAAWRAAGTAVPLVIVGPDGWQAATALGGIAVAPDARSAAELGAGAAAVRAPWLPRPAVLALVRGAKALLMPSLAEGFGLPVAEAMALGTPAMASSSGALAEVAGDAALLVDPLDVRAIADGIAALDGDAGLRSELASRGLRRSGLFRPEAYAERLRTLYARVLADPWPGIAARGAV